MTEYLLLLEQEKTTLTPKQKYQYRQRNVIFLTYKKFKITKKGTNRLKKNYKSEKKDQKIKKLTQVPIRK